MRAWNVSVFGDTYRIVSSSHKDGSKAENEDIVISPGISTDFILRTKTENESSCLCAVLAVAKLIFLKLSYPRMELDIDTRVGVYKVWRESDRICAKTPKCKLKFTKEELEIGGINIPFYESGENCGIIFCESPFLSDFDSDYLSSVYYREEKNSLKGVFAAEKRGKELFFKSYPEVDKVASFLLFSEFLFQKGRISPGNTFMPGQLGEKIHFHFDCAANLVASVFIN